MKIHSYFFSFFVVTAFLSGCSSTPEIASTWKRSEIVVDGLDNEWQQDLQYFEDEKIAVGIKNDASDLYLSIKTIDRETQMKIVRGGMTIWFDSTGGQKKIFGIHFPLGVGAVGEIPTHTRGSREAQDETNDYRALEERFEKMLQNMEIIGPGPVDKKQIPVVTSFQSFGIKVGMRDTMGALFFEVIVPLRISPRTPLAIGSDIGKTLGISITTESTRRSMTARSPDEGAPNGGYGKPGMGDGRRGGGSGRFGPGMESSPIELHLKAKIAQKM